MIDERLAKERAERRIQKQKRNDAICRYVMEHGDTKAVFLHLAIKYELSVCHVRQIWTIAFGSWNYRRHKYNLPIIVTDRRSTKRERFVIVSADEYHIPPNLRPKLRPEEPRHTIEAALRLVQLLDGDSEIAAKITLTHEAR